MPDRRDLNPSAPPSSSNAFSRDFLRRLDERDEPITSAEADMAGPWSVEPLVGRGFGLFRAGERPPRGFSPYAIFPDRFLALLAAAALPGTGREPLLSLARDPDPDDQGYAVRLDDGTVVGHLLQFDQTLLEAINGLVGVLRVPGSLAFVMEAAGAITLERAGAILEERVRAAALEAGP
jgi:hypothetical protein